MQGEGQGLCEAFETSDDPTAYRAGRRAFEARLRFAESLSWALVHATCAGDAQRQPTRKQYEDHQVWVRTFAPYLLRFRAANPGTRYPKSTALVRWCAAHSVTWAELDQELGQLTCSSCGECADADVMADASERSPWLALVCPACDARLTVEEHAELDEVCPCDLCRKDRDRAESRSLRKLAESAGGLRLVDLLEA